mmetsp:Transcript_9724/g.14346  ORF Transcript_9724/g.14346 Transcript_9724/m.14346 type:complete len:1139 (+) Transcript_9724:70-3486(+)
MVRNIKEYTNKRIRDHRQNQRPSSHHAYPPPHHHNHHPYNQHRQNNNHRGNNNRNHSFNSPPHHHHHHHHHHKYHGGRERHFDDRGNRYDNRRENNTRHRGHGDNSFKRQPNLTPNYSRKDPRDEFIDRLNFATNPTATHFTIPNSANMYVVMVDNPDDVHKSIKYGKWSCPSSLSNSILDELYHKQASKKTPIYLLFTTASSKCFFGIAQMRGRCHFDEVFPLWHQTAERCGLFFVEWIFIKDYDKSSFQDIQITRETRHPLKRDTQEYATTLADVKKDILVDNEQNVRTILKRFIRHKHSDSILNRWGRYEQDEVILRRRRAKYIRRANERNMLPFKYRSRSISSISDDVCISSVDETNDITIPTDIGSVKSRIRERSFEVDTNLTQLFKDCVFMYEFTYLNANRQRVQPLIEKRGGVLQRTFLITTVTHVITSQTRLDELPDRLIPVLKKLDKMYLINAKYVEDCVAQNKLLDLQDPTNQQLYFLKIPPKGEVFVNESSSKSVPKKAKSERSESKSSSNTIYLPQSFWDLFSVYMEKKKINVRSNAFRAFSNFLVHAVSEFTDMVEQDSTMKQSDSNKQRQRRKRLGKIFILDVWDGKKQVSLSEINDYIARVNKDVENKMSDDSVLTGKDAVTHILEQWCYWDARMIQKTVSLNMPESFLKTIKASPKISSYNNKQSAITSFCTFVSVHIDEAKEFVKKCRKTDYKSKIQYARKWVKEHWEDENLRDKFLETLANWEKVEHRSKQELSTDDVQLNVKRQKFIPITENLYIGSHWKNLLSALPSPDKCCCLPHCISLRMYMPNNGDKCCGDRCINRASKIECTHAIHQPNAICKNQRIQQKKWKKTIAKPVKNKGIGLFAQEEIHAGDFVIEYVGEVINDEEMEKRKKIYQEMGQQHYYFMRIEQDMVIDSFAKANNSRYINHSCDPNITVEKWKVGKKTVMGFFALRDIAFGEELSYDYSFQRFGSGGTVCFCGAKNCRGIIQAKSTKKSTPFETRLKKNATQLRNDVRRLIKNYQHDKPFYHIKRIEQQLEAIHSSNLFLMRNIRSTAEQRYQRIEAIRQLIEEELAEEMSNDMVDDPVDDAIPESLLASMSRSEIRQYRQMLGKERKRKYSSTYFSDDDDEDEDTLKRKRIE